MLLNSEGGSFRVDEVLGSSIGVSAGGSFVVGDAAGRSGLVTEFADATGLAVEVAVLGVMICPATGVEVANFSDRSVTEVAAIVEVANATSPFPAVKT